MNKAFIAIVIVAGAITVLIALLQHLDKRDAQRRRDREQEWL